MKSNSYPNINILTERTSPFKPVTHVIINCTGVIFDTEEFRMRSLSTLLAKFRKEPLTSEEYSKFFSGKNFVDICDTCIKEFKISAMKKYERVYKLWNNVIVKLLEDEPKYRNVQFMPGAQSLTKHLRSIRVPIGFLTHHSMTSFNDTIRSQHAEYIENTASVFITSNDSANGFPHSEPYYAVYYSFPVRPKSPLNCLVLDTTPAGVMSARTAGMQVIMLPDYWVPQFIREDAPTICTSLRDLDLTLFRLPAIKKPIPGTHSNVLTMPVMGSIM